MIITGLCPRDAIARLFGLRQKRYGNLFDFCSECTNRPNTHIKAFLNFIGNHVKEKFSRYPESKFGKFYCSTPMVAFSFVISPVNNGPKKNRRIRNGACQRPNTIVRHRQRNHTRHVHAIKTWLKPYNAAQRRRYSNGASRIRANTAKTKSSSHRGGRTTARTSRNSLHIPRISRRSIVRIVICDPISKLVHVTIRTMERR